MAIENRLPKSITSIFEHRNRQKRSGQNRLQILIERKMAETFTEQKKISRSGALLCNYKALEDSRKEIVRIRVKAKEKWLRVQTILMEMILQ